MAYRIRHQSPILLCSGVAIPLVKLQVWSFHKWYHYTTARQYRGLMTNSGMPSFLVGTQDIGPRGIMSHSCPNLVSTSFLYIQSLYSFSNLQIFFFNYIVQ